MFKHKQGVFKTNPDKWLILMISLEVGTINWNHKSEKNRYFNILQQKLHSDTWFDCIITRCNQGLIQMQIFA